MKKIIGFVMAIVLFMPISNVYANENTDADVYVRVGLKSKYSASTSIPITNKSIDIGLVIDDTFVKSVHINANEALAIKIANGYYIKTNENFATYEEALEYSNSIMGVPYVSGHNSWSVYKGPFDNEAVATEEGSRIGGDVIIPNNQTIALIEGSATRILFDGNCKPGIFSEDFVTLGDRKYRGVIEFGKNSQGGILPINILTLEEYLYSVTPSEMPSKWHEEALKAQACAARSYTLTSMNGHQEENYHLCDDIHCQVYLGAGNEAESTTNAVKATKNQRILYKDKPINAVYFSSSGGITQNSEDVWPNEIPYLRSVGEVSELESKEWAREFSREELKQILGEKAGSIGDVKSIAITGRYSSGRVSEITIYGTNDNLVLKGSQARTFCSSIPGGALDSNNFEITTGSVIKIDESAEVSDTNWSGSDIAAKEVNQDNDVQATSQNNTSLDNSHTSGDGYINYSVPKSENVPATETPKKSDGFFNFEKVKVLEGQGDNIVFYGKGWGHGVGMSQFGAKGMAESGYTYEEILKHYYTDVEVR